MVRALAVVPGVLARLREDPAMVPAFAEEAMRWDAAAQGFVRSPTREIHLHGTVIPVGSQVLVHIGAANRDERQFERPDDLDIDRSIQRHLGLGHGTHFCVGAPLGRMLARIAMEELVACAPALELDAVRSRRVTTPNFRGFTHLYASVG
jgi:cytochrome P450